MPEIESPSKKLELLKSGYLPTEPHDPEHTRKML